MSETDRESPRWSAEQRSVISLDVSRSGVVIGAPGAGKTRTAMERVRALLAAGEVSARQILLLTPSRSTATRTRDIVGVQVAMATPGALARSIGSFAFHIVQAAAAWAEQPNPQLLTGADQDRLIADLLASDELDEERGIARWPSDALPAIARSSPVFRSELRAFLSECTQLALTPSELARIAHQQSNEPWAAVASFWNDYRAVLAHMRPAYRESAEFLAEAAEVIALASVEGNELGELRHVTVVIVDDAQELTRAGLDLLRALRRRGVAVLAFGDPDISSGSFRGATSQLFSDLAAELSVAGVLTGSFRQSDALVHVTRSVTQGIGAGGRIEHRVPPGPRPDPDGSVTVLIADSLFAEADIIARRLREWHVRDQIGWSDMAVLAHDTRQVTALETELAAREVPTRAAGVQRPLAQEPAVRDILRVVSLAMTEPGTWDGEEIATILLSPFGGLDAVGLRRLRARLRHRELADGGSTGAVILLARAFVHELELTLIDTPEARIAERVAKTLRLTRAAYMRGDTAHDLLWMVWESARLFGRPLGEVWRDASASMGASAAEASRSLDALVALFDAAKRAVERAPEAGPGAFIDELRGSDVPEDSLSSPERAGTVTVMTPATALGTEFEAIVIAGVQDGVWPNVRLRATLLNTWSLSDVVGAFRGGIDDRPATAAIDRRRMAVHDELRLFVRAVSRARTRLLVTAVSDDDQTPSPLFSLLPEPETPSLVAEHPLTLRGLIAQHRRTLTSATGVTAHEQQRAAAELAVLAAEGVAGADPLDWYGVMARSSNAPLRDANHAPISVSPSRLEGFETCAVDWAIRSIGGNTSTWSTGLGTILHAAMEEVPSGDIDELEHVVMSRWGELEFEADWLGEKEKRWAKILIERIAQYMKNVEQNDGTRVGAETEFKVLIPFDATSPVDLSVLAEGAEAALPSVVLSGSIDRIERYPAHRGELLPFDESRPDHERVVIVDLKTGRSEKRVSDDKVKTDAQLAAYQLALRAGALEGVAPDEGAGARLVVISQELPSQQMRYRIAHQPPLTETEYAGFIERVISGAKLMAADSFTAPVDDHCDHEKFAVCRIHTIGSVSAW